MTCAKPTCATYSVTFSADGKAEYVGGQGAPRRGDYVAMGDFKPLIEHVDAQHPERLAWRYGPLSGPRTRVIIVIRHGGHQLISESVRVNDAPPAFAEIVRAIDDLASKVAWRSAR